ncbi:MAG: hypothetical protein HYX46_10020 [Betaproteobacteria bacterium]|nr:hypothetical protein [Betaproteobacteria bacterium]
MQTGDLPSFKEQGIDVELGNWRAIFGTPGICVQQRDASVFITPSTPKLRSEHKNRIRPAQGLEYAM